jgi:hypothetical protein
LDAAICRVKFAIGSGVLLEIRELISSEVSVSRETLKSTLMLELITVISLLVSGTEEANVHSSSSFVALVLLCAKLEDGAGTAPPRRSTVAEGAGGCLMDCWYWNGEAWRGVEVRAAKGSGERAGGIEGCAKADGGGVDICCGVEVFVDANRSLICCAEVFFCWAWGTGIPDNPRTARESVCGKGRRVVALT